jgi:large subunit ribosomal protein L7/L12
MIEYERQIQKLEARLRQLRVRKQRGDARHRALEAKRSRREETRRKILVGAVVLMQVDRGALDTAVLRQWLDSALTRADERALFDL